MASLLDLFITISAIDRVSSTLDGIGSKSDATAKGIGKSFGSTGNILEKLGENVSKAFTAKKVLDFGVACVQSASDAETGFAKVNTLLADGTNTTAFFDSIKNASLDTGVAINDFSEAVYSAISASVDQGNAVEFTTQAVKLAKGGFTDTATAVDILTTAINAYGLSASDATAISDKLIMTQNLGKTTVGELGEAMGRVIPTAKSFGVDLDALCAVYAVMTKNGIATAESTTYVNSMLNELGKSGTKAANVLKSETGKSFTELMNSGYSLSDVLEILNQNAQKSGLSINDMFGSAEAGKAANVLIDKSEELISITDQMAGSAGSTEKAYQKMMATYAEQLGILTNKFAIAKTKIGEAFLPVLSAVVTHFDDIEVAAGSLAAAISVVLVGRALANSRVAFMANAEALKYFVTESGKAAVAEATLSGTFSAGEVITGLLTGQISLATAAQAGLNAVMSASPVLWLAAGFAAVTFAVKRGTEAYKSHIQEVAGTAESEEEAAAKVAELTKKIDDLKKSASESGWSDALTQELADTQAALKISQGQLLEFQKASGKAAATATEPVDAFTAASNEYATQVEALFTKASEDYATAYSNVSSWFEPFGAAATTVKTSIGEIMANMQSQIDFNSTYSENLRYLSEAGLGGLSEAFQASGADGAAFAATIAQSIKDAGGATTEEGQNIVNNLTSMFTELKQSQSDLATDIVTTSGDINTAVGDMTEKYADQLKDLDKSAEGKQYAINTMNAFIEGINDGSGDVEKIMGKLGDIMTTALQNNIGTITFDVVAKSGRASASSNITIGSHANGLDYVPYDGYIASLHRGETVLTQAEAAEWRGGGEKTYIQTVTVPAEKTNIQIDSRVLDVLYKILDSMGDNLSGDIKNSNRGISRRDFDRAVRSVG